MEVLKFNRPDDLIELENFADIDGFLQKMKDVGEINVITGNYNEDIYKLCNNVIAWLLIQMKDTLFIYNSEVAIGTFDGQDHTWLIIGDYYVDPSLAQFVPDAPKIAFINKEDTDRYYIDETLFPHEFVERINIQRIDRV